MTNPIVLNHETHADTRVITSRGAEFGENTHIVPVVADELEGLALEYPVCLTKDTETGQFGLTALLGFEQGENLFLQGEHWDASYVPINVLRQPFMIALQPGDDGSPQPNNAVISIDMDSNRVQESDGERLFDQHGKKTPYLENIAALLAHFMSGIKSTEAFLGAISELNLIEPAALTVTFQGVEKKYDGLYTISTDKLRELAADELLDLHTKGYLQASYLMLASMGNIKKLIGRKNERLKANA